MKGIVITGPTGAVGMALIKKCLEKNIPVLAICHRNSKRLDIMPENSKLIVWQINLEEFAECQIESERQYDVFYHLAWDGTYGDVRNDLYIQQKNIKYALDAVALAKKLGCHTFVGAGSQAEYGRVDGVLKPDTPVFPENGYGMAKLCAGQMSRKLCRDMGMKHIWTRILSVYGPYDKEYTMVMSTILKMLASEKTSFTKAEQIWDYLYSEDAAEILLRLAEKGNDGKVYCLGSGRAMRLRDYIEIMKKETGTLVEPEYGAVPYLENQVMHLEAEIQKVIEDTGYCPQTSFQEGIRKTISYVESLKANRKFD